MSSVRGLLLCVCFFFTYSTDKNRSHRFGSGELAGHNPLLILVSPQSLNSAQNWSRREVLHRLALKKEVPSRSVRVQTSCQNVWNMSVCVYGPRRKLAEWSWLHPQHTIPQSCDNLTTLPQLTYGFLQTNTCYYGGSRIHWHDTKSHQ
jgi:hypothetical protein